ncbi:UNVERIFIED_ORG: hypothetical protein BCL66_105187 [Martelella mediterranea]
MVSGWDKSPGPDNDYASRPWTKKQMVLCGLVAATGFLLLCAAGLGLFPI